MGIRYKVFSAIDALGKGPDLLKTPTGSKPFILAVLHFPSFSFSVEFGPMVAAPPFRREEGCSLFGEASGTYFPPDLFQGLCCLCLKHRQPALCPPIFMRPFMHARILARLGPPEAPPACQPAFARVARMP